MQRALCPRLIGREPELGALEDALLAASRGDGALALLTGDAGMGKTRLAGELMARARRLGFTVLEGGCSEAEVSIPYLPFVEAIGNHLAHADVDRLRAQLGPAAAELAQLFPRLGRPDEANAGGDPGYARLRLFEAIADLMRRLAEGTGLLLVLEDLHWTDTSTRELLDFLARRLRTGRVLLLGTYRADELHRKHPLLPLLQGWRRAGLVEAVELRPLQADDVAAMICAIFDAEEISDEFQDFMHDRTEGNPFVLEEMLKLSVERGDIYRAGDGWERKSLSDVQLPRTVRDAILLRLERLPREHVEVLGMAAVLGRTFDPSVLAAALTQSEQDVEDALQAAQQQQILVEESDSSRYGFRHALTREVIYDDLPAPRRERLHLKAAEVIRQVRPGATEELVAHLMAGGAFAEAVPLCIEAGRQASAKAAYEEALVLLRRALPHITEPRARADLLGDLGLACSRAGETDAALEYLQQGIDILEELGDQLEAARRRVELGRAWGWRGDSRREAEEYRRAADVLETAGPSEALATAYMRHAAVHTFNGEAAEARALAERALEVSEAAGAEEVRIWTDNFLGLALATEGRLDECVEHLWRSYHEAVRRGFLYIAGNALNNLAAVLMWDGRAKAREALAVVPLMRELRAGSWSTTSPLLVECFGGVMVGDFDGAIAAARRAIELAGGGNVWVTRYAEVGISLALTESGRLDEAAPLIGIGDVEVQRDQLEAAALMRFHLAGGEPDQAMAGAERVRAWVESNLRVDPFALELALETACAADSLELADALLGATPSWLLAFPYLRRGLARVELAHGRPERALEPAEEALAAFAAAGYRPDEARTAELLADVAAALGRSEEAEARRAAAAALRPPAAARAASEETPATGERLVTVLFADVRGYTALAATIPPADLSDRIAALHRWGAAEVERHRGTVDKFAGDALMATFNISGATVVHTAQAIQAALALRDKAALLGLQLGIGIATGAAVVGRLRAGANLSVLGETTNLASRLQGAAAAGEILLSSEAHRRVEGWLTERGLAAEPASLQLKGIGGEVDAFRLAAPVAVSAV